MTADREHMVRTVPYHTKINLAEDKRSLKAEAKGDIRVNTRTQQGKNTIDIKNVLFVPMLRINLLSVSQLNRHGLKVLFEKFKARIIGPRNNVIAEAQEKNGIFILGGEIIRGTEEEGLNCQEDCQEKEINQEVVDEGKVRKKMLRHKKLCHICENYLDQMIKGNTVRDLKFTQEELEICQSCVLGKLTQNPHKVKGYYTTQPMQLIYEDLCGPMPTPSITGKKYIYVYICARRLQ